MQAPRGLGYNAQRPEDGNRVDSLHVRHEMIVTASRTFTSLPVSHVSGEMDEKRSRLLCIGRKERRGVLFRASEASSGETGRFDGTKSFVFLKEFTQLSACCERRQPVFRQQPASDTCQAVGSCHY
jgi:hypothetical protein